MAREWLSLDLAHYPVQVLGPGRRVVVWVRGCHLGCPGCMSRDLAEDPSSPRIPVDQLTRSLEPWARAADGLTITGGEPFEQAGALAALVRALRAAGLRDVMVYTGYTLDQLAGLGPGAADLLEASDALIDGRYREDLPTRKLWRGSDNQVLHCLSEGSRARYGPYVDATYPGRRPLQLAADGRGRLFVVGIPERDDLERFEAGCRRRGIRLGKEGTGLAEGARP